MRRRQTSWFGAVVAYRLLAVYPLAFVADRVGGEHADVTDLTSARP